MGANLLHAYQCTISESGSGGGTGIVGPNEWNADHQLYLDVNAQTLTTYTIAASDDGALVTFNNSSAVAVTLPQAQAGVAAIGSALGFYKGWFCFARNLGTGAVTITPTTSTIDGGSTLVLAQNQSAKITSDGANYQVEYTGRVITGGKVDSSPVGAGTPSTGAFTTLSATSTVSGAGMAAIHRSYLAGLGLSNDGTTPNSVLDIAAGVCVDSTNATFINLGAFTKSTAGGWTAGSGNNGMGGGLTVSASTWYHVFAIINSGTPDVYFDTSVTAANAPSSTTAFRRIGSFRTDASSHILAFSQNGDEFLWKATVGDVNSSGGYGTTATAVTLTVPPGVEVWAKVRYVFFGVSGNCLLYPPDQSVQVSNSPPGNASNNSAASGGGLNNTYSDNTIRTNTAQQVMAVSSAASTSLQLVTYGWIDRRGRDN